MARRNRSVYGHHGTTKKRAAEILKRGFELSECEPDWLGFGIYFWEDSPSRARSWGKKKYPACPVCIVDAEISLERCLNLADPDGVARLEPYFGFLIKAVGTEIASTLKSTAEGNRELDCRVINYACERWKESGDPVHVVRGAFEEGDPIFKGGEGVSPSQIKDLSHVQLAVREDCAILDVLIAD